MTLRIICFLCLIDVIIDAQLTNCPKINVHFEKVLGLRPPASRKPLLLFRGSNVSAITLNCLNLCNANNDCRSFSIFYNVSTCYWYKTAIEGSQEFETEADTNVSWFIKVCLQVNNYCKNLWTFDRIPGATLVGNNTKILSKLVTRRECQQNCLDEKQFDCKSVKFKIKIPDYGPNPEIQGVCTLSDADRHLFPNAFRVSSYDNEYFENQCSDDNYDNNGQFCSYEEYSNATLSHSDLIFFNKTKDDCQVTCEIEDRFNCRGFSILSNKTSTDCYLHSEDSKVFGPKLLTDTSLGKYFEKTPCLNISVTCSEIYMTVHYLPQIKFLGRMYMDGYSDHSECSVKGSGNLGLELKLSLLSAQCGIFKAQSPDARTLMAGTMILQYNPLVQTQGDRVIRIGCLFGNDSKILAGTGITITTIPNHASPLINSTGNIDTPTVQMKVVDASSQEEVSSTQIGQELQLIIELKPADGIDIWAGHLIAMTADGSESILLLDDNGCPTNPDIFPALRRVTTSNSIRLESNFQAFKFSSSPIVRFSVIVQFCPGTCPQISCDPRLQKRELDNRYVQTFDGTKVSAVNRSEFQKNPIRTPLEFVMIVRNSTGNSERLVVGDGKILIAGYDYISHEVCLDYSLFLGLLITWVLIQVILVVCCIVMVRRYRKYYENEMLRQSLEELNKNFGIGFSNLDNRRVHWADNEEYT